VTRLARLGFSPARFEVGGARRRRGHRRDSGGEDHGACECPKTLQRW
jgi:hypothetical protein